MKIKANDLMILLSWLYGEKVIKNRTNDFKYLELYTQLMYSEPDAYVDVNEESLKDIMNSNYEFYIKFSKEDTLDKIRIISEQMVDKEKMFKMGKELLDEYENLYEKISFKYPLNFKFQKAVLKRLMDENIKKENYEMCSKLRDKIKKLK